MYEKYASITDEERLEENKMAMQSSLEALRLSFLGEDDYHQMMVALIDEMQQKTEKLQDLTKRAALPIGIKRLMNEWQAFVEEFIELLTSLQSLDYMVIKKKRAYEGLEELMADVDDWIDEADETLESCGESISYMEAWDIGVFF